MSNLLHRYRRLDAAAQGLKENLADRTALLEDVLTRVVIDTIRRYQQRVNVGIQDSVTDLLSAFKLKVAEEVLRVSQNWIISTHREPVLFPPNCRFLYTLGASTIVVVEQSPAIRTLHLDTSLMDIFAERSTGVVQTRSLAMPYTIFVLHLRNTQLDGTGKEHFCNLYIGWRPTPLSSLKDEIFTPFLPNIYPNNHTVCTGYTDCVAQATGGAGVTELTNKLITDFWNSNFNSDLSQHWSTKPITLDEWDRKSREDPLFILDVRFSKPKTIDQMIKDITMASEERSPESMDIRHQIAEQTDELAEKLFHGIKNYLFKTKFDRFYPKDVTESLSGAMDGMAKQLQAVALGIEMQLNDMSQDMSELKRRDYGWRRRGPYWTD